MSVFDSNMVDRGDASTCVTLLLSGGLDSAACLEFYLSQGFDVSALHVQYGQAAAINERHASTDLAEHFGVKLRVLEWSGKPSKSVGEIVARNAFLIFAAAMECQHATGLIGIGLHAGTPYFDCSQRFLTEAQQVLDGYTNGQLQVAAPFLTWGKENIWQFCLSRHVPVNLTYSCEAGGELTCGTCSSCIDRKALDAFQNIDNPTPRVGSRA